MQFFKSFPLDIRKARTFYESVSKTFPWLLRASHSKCVSWCQQVQISVSQINQQSTVAGGSFIALDVNFQVLSYQKVVKYIYDFIPSQCLHEYFHPFKMLCKLYQAVLTSVFMIVRNCYQLITTSVIH